MKRRKTKAKKNGKAGNVVRRGSQKNFLKLRKWVRIGKRGRSAQVNSTLDQRVFTLCFFRGGGLHQKNSRIAKGGGVKRTGQNEGGKRTTS